MPYKHNKNLVPVAKMLRKNMTAEENELWYKFLRLYPIKFLRQKILGNYVADFYCASAKLVVELDGSQHNTPEGVRYDTIRTEFLQEYGLLVLRIPNALIYRDFKTVCAYIDELVQKRLER